MRWILFISVKTKTPFVYQSMYEVANICEFFMRISCSKAPAAVIRKQYGVELIIFPEDIA